MRDRGASVAWSDAEIKLLLKLASENKSGTQIGKQLNRSRNAVIGKLNRCGVRWDHKNKTWTDPNAGVYIVGHGNEAICTGSSKNAVVYRALRLLNEELPEGEKRYTEREVRGMVRQTSKRGALAWEVG